jgi:hypothetical protein
MSLRSHSLLEPRIVRHGNQRGCSVRIARAVRYARVLRIGPGHRSALMTRAETSSPKRGNEILLSVEPDKLGQRERERERERERGKREKERERACVSVCPGFFSVIHPQRAAREYGAPPGGGNQGCGVRGCVKKRWPAQDSNLESPAPGADALSSCARPNQVKLHEISGCATLHLTSTSPIERDPVSQSVRFFFCGPPTGSRARLRRATGRREPGVRGAWKC